MVLTEMGQDSGQAAATATSYPDIGRGNHLPYLSSYHDELYEDDDVLLIPLPPYVREACKAH